ncbi:diaminopropionate ammonia-lyase [Promethearchaeum syntrophicum]|uniref:Diaminopropionate ammonia-lyase n=1 Tax=Promethearchaeum syntrophicum TaxID=2594042 RepID=A0A5B9DCV0_9ARCH|nr:diaminopropionate ammonia-lyase [Candidatus Prometheoarchaeum syntrophicum]QEE16536.1 Threonine synthase [Candidatus Prometheoarchaeum syntrophicum]
MSVFLNKRAKGKLRIEKPSQKPFLFHQKLPEYKITPLISLKSLAKNLKIGNIWVKDESNRLGLPAFKILGASWAVYRNIEEKFNIHSENNENFPEFIKKIKKIPSITLITATDGNHGRAVARIAKLYSWNAKIFMPEGSKEARINAILSEGAQVIIVKGDYDLAVQEAAKLESKLNWVIQDTAYENYEKIPKWIIEGYSTLCWEIDNQLSHSKIDLIFIQIGVGSLASAIIKFYKHENYNESPKILGIEPLGVACAKESVKAGKIVTINGPYNSIMAGLNCGTISKISWPLILAGIDGFIEVSNDFAIKGMKTFSNDGIISGETGASGLGGLLELTEQDNGKLFRHQFNLNENSNVLIFSTEGATDPDFYNNEIKKSNIFEKKYLKSC